MSLDKFRFPIGDFKIPKDYNKQIIETWINDIRKFPSQIRKMVDVLSLEQLEKTYRQEGWSIIQVVNHCADSHMNAFIRFKLALTEKLPIIKPYEEAKWAELSDGLLNNLISSILLLKGLHSRWVFLLNSLSENDLKKCYYHPEHQKKIELRVAIANYSWHCKHHLAHIELAIKNR